MRKAAAVVACLTVPLLLVFLAICVAEVVLGWMLWRNLRGAVVLSFVVLPFELLFWWGFALPFAFPFGVVRTVLVLGHLLRRRPPALSA